MWLILTLLIPHSFASDQWLCSTQSSHINGDEIQVCGMGRGMNEETARMAALEDAKLEFQELCSMGSNCEGKRWSVDPGRTTCNPETDHYICFRLFTYILTKY